MSDKQTMDCCHRNGCKNWDISSYGNCQLSDRDFKKCGQIYHYKPKTMPQGMEQTLVNPLKGK